MRRDAEFAILVRSDLKGLGLGKLMMEKIIRYAGEQGIGQLSGMTMPSNRGMINLAKRLGFKIDIQMEEGVVNMLLPCSHRRLRLNKIGGNPIQNITPTPL